MIIVSGTERSRTSLTMEILGKLGLNVIGDKWPRGKKDKSSKLNPNGFYEVKGEVMHGTSTDYGNDAVIKILLSGLVPHKRKNKELGVPEEMLRKSKIIVCLRNPKEIVRSSKDLDSNIKIADGDDWNTSLKLSPENPGRYINRTANFVVWLSTNKWILDNMIFINTDDYYTDPNTVLTQLCVDLGLSTDRIADAIKLIDNKLYRSSDNYEWKENMAKDGALAERIFKALKSKKVTTVAKDIKKIMKDNMPEKIKWLDTEFNTNSFIGPSMYRSLKINNRGVRDKLQLTGKKRQVVCDNLASSDEQYTIPRPTDIGDLTRNKIYCSKDNISKTLEECHYCYNYRGGK
jgi:hypothetical protein